MVAGLRGVLGSTRDEDSAVVGLDGAEPDWYHKVNVQHLSLLALVVHVVECHDFLVELEKVNFVCPK